MPLPVLLGHISKMGFVRKRRRRHTGRKKKETKKVLFLFLPPLSLKTEAASYYSRRSGAAELSCGEGRMLLTFLPLLPFLSPP